MFDRGKTTASVCSTGPAPEAQLNSHSSRSLCSSGIESSHEKAKVCMSHTLFSVSVTLLCFTLLLSVRLIESRRLVHVKALFPRHY